ncbi:chorismate-binding protein [Microbacterium azadirachtae]|uniref:isochorismate synthase n=1 Tax=Microbacterium azadirachtae TaxID=582680 RepID=A0A0F0KZZ3_9MICO|nr:chorismate-binding protein [Microbacterium azadirachtae]KJL26024.1 Isochorismate synthase DhbC [Microbacterium azadirachtae]UXW85319.1 chorismate-binding protein [Microbacterium azadirachtae]
MSAGLVVQTREFDLQGDLLGYADPADPRAWLRRGDGIVAVGAETARVVRAARGPESRTSALARAWDDIRASATVDDTVQLPGTGLVAFAALVFDEESSAESVLLVPRTVIGRHGGRTWITHVLDAPASGDTDGSAIPAPTALGPHWAGTLGPGAQTAQGYQASVRAALSAIAEAQYGKVVLARDLVGTVPAGSDLRRLVRALSTEYPDTWAFAVDRLIGASPETLVTVQDGVVTARVLAGTTARGADAVTDARAAAALADSPKDNDEHAFAVRSVVASLAPHTTALDADGGPFILELPNLFHLATDVRARLSDGASALDLAAALHPTAAVAGTPTDAAVAAIRELEPFDRGRYAGPVGWIDARGNGEWAIALRCAQFGVAGSGVPIPLTAYAGAGIVAGSDPEAELLETRVKFRPIVDALA